MNKEGKKLGKQKWWNSDLTGLRFNLGTETFKSSLAGFNIQPWMGNGYLKPYYSKCGL